MENYRLYVNDRSYMSWNIFDNSNYKNVNIDINPIEEKLFSNDVFQYICTNDKSERLERLEISETSKKSKIKLIHSSIRCGPPMPGVLILNSNKTYGRKNGKLLYKCIPDDCRLPYFLVPYDMKNMGFSKVFKNLYVTFSFSSWDEKHPHGILNHIIGEVDVLDNFYEYQLYCKSLNASIQKFNKDTSKALQNKSHELFIENIKERFPSITDRTSKEWNIFTIDPNKSLDFDDGYSIKKLNDINDNYYQISIYIANVTLWLDVLNLWNSFSKRISTIYLPDKRRPMLPTILSDCICSLLENCSRIAFVMDIYVKDYEIIDIKYSNSIIKVKKNYIYEENELLMNTDYLLLLDMTKHLSTKYKYISNVRNSHEMVSYLMILMNYHCAKEMIKHKSGVFRSTIMKKETIVPENVPDDVCKFIKIWNSSTGQYVDGSLVMNTNNDNSNDSNIIRHDMLELEAYIHITSPIRRLVDLLNVIKFQQNLNIINLSENAENFYKKWLADLDYINVTMRSIKKVQIDCSLLDLCANNPNVMEKEYDGYLFDKLNRNDGLFQFMVYLPELRLSSRITMRENFENFENKKFKLYLFNDEENFKKKIRLHLL